MVSQKIFTLKQVGKTAIFLNTNPTMSTAPSSWKGNLSSQLFPQVGKIGFTPLVAIPSGGLGPLSRYCGTRIMHKEVSLQHRELPVAVAPGISPASTKKGCGYILLRQILMILASNSLMSESQCNQQGMRLFQLKQEDLSTPSSLV